MHVTHSLAKKEDGLVVEKRNQPQSARCCMISKGCTVAQDLLKNTNAKLRLDFMMGKA